MRPALIARRPAALLALVLASACAGEADQPRPMSGEELYRHWCADCHDAGPGHPGTLRIAAREEADRAALTARANDAETVRYAVRNGFQMMPPFRMTEISDEELERLVQFLSEPRS